MPVFTEESSPEMLQRAAGLKESPLPRISAPAPENADRTADGARHEVVVIGTGPAGIMLSLMLSRYGVSCLPVEKVTSMIIPGQADGLQPRTLEVLRMLGLSEEVFSQGFLNYRMAFWSPGQPGEPRLVRTAVTDDVTVPSRYRHKILLAAGRVVNILERQMNKYGNEVARGLEFVSFELVGGEFPVKVTLKDVVTGRQFSVFAKHLVGADGAHSVVREQMGVKLQGESTDYIWGVVDAVLKTDFPDIRKRCAIHSDAASIMTIPREKIENEQYLTRLYTQLEETIDITSTASTSTLGDQEAKARAKERRQRVTLPRILEQITRTMEPYHFEVVKVDWWAAYQIGQRVATKFALQDKEGRDRVLIMGDACHTHSPKAGQGMNVSMMDGYNLGWKLAYELLGLAPEGSLLPSYEFERRDIAQQLIAFDNSFASKFSQKMEPEAGGLTHEEFFKVFHTGGGFTSGCGIEYEQSNLVKKNPVKALDGTLNPDFGLLRAGRRLMNIHLRRFSDDVPIELHDALPSNGHHVVLVLLPQSFGSPKVQKKLQYLTTTLPQMFVAGIVEPFIVHPLKSNDEIEWSEFPRAIKEDWEWNFLGDVNGQGYETLGVDREAGAVAILRPDGVLGGVWDLDELVAQGQVESWFVANLATPAAKPLL